MAANTARNLSGHYGELAASTRRLSSGLRITTAADDAAGLAVRELMRSDISTLNQGIKNANDAISMVQTADGALQVIDEKLIRMKELAEQAATGTYSSDQRIIIDSEFQAMASEITRIANATDFNGIYLLNGNLSGNIHDGSGLSVAGKLKVHFGAGNSSAEDYYYIQIGCCTASALGLVGSLHSLVTIGGQVGTTESQYVIDNNLTNFPNVTNWHDIFLNTPGTTYSNTPQDVKDKFDPTEVPSKYRDQSGVFIYLFGLDTSGNMHVLKARWGVAASYISDTVISALSGTTISLGSSFCCVSTQELAQQALAKVTSAIVSKDKIRANLGAVQNRLENTISNLAIQAENLQAAESQISDVDVAEEMTSFVREQILTQAAVAMLSQANSLPKMAMQLIQG